jgi:hypothetical protein
MMRPMTQWSRRAFFIPNPKGENMSWSISGELKELKSGDTDELLLKAIDTLTAVDRTNIGNSHCEKERDEQIDAAIRAASQLIVEGGFGNAEEITVSLSGHANKEHKRDSSWSNEFISVQVYLKGYRPE